MDNLGKFKLDQLCECIQRDIDYAKTSRSKFSEDEAMFNFYDGQIDAYEYILTLILYL